MQEICCLLTWPTWPPLFTGGSGFTAWLPGPAYHHFDWSYSRTLTVTMTLSNPINPGVPLVPVGLQTPVQGKHREWQILTRWLDCLSFETSLPADIKFWMVRLSGFNVLLKWHSLRLIQDFTHLQIHNSVGIYRDQLSLKRDCYAVSWGWTANFNRDTWPASNRFNPSGIPARPLGSTSTWFGYVIQSVKS